MDLKEKLEGTRVPIEQVDLSSIIPSNISDEMEVKGRIAERLVYEWLHRAGFDFDEDFPRQSDGYDWNLTPEGILVTRNNRAVHEFDFLAFYEGVLYVVEVKSLKLNGIESKIPRALHLASELYQQEVGMLLFFPAYTNKKQDAEHICRNNPQVQCVDIGYKKKNLLAAINRFYVEHAKTNGS